SVVGQGSRGPDSHQFQTVHAQGAWVSRSDHQTELSHQNHFVRRVIVWVKKPIQSACASLSIKTGAPNGLPRRKNSVLSSPKTARSATSSRKSSRRPPSPRF